MDEPDDELAAERPEMARPRSGGPLGADSGSALDRAAAAWQRRGYEVWYRDEYLVQLVRRGLPDGPFLLLLIVCFLALVAAILAALRRRPWTVISLSVSPEGRVIVHRQRARRPPPL
jgi:hypothetical protein